jgi:hypothetical protein
METIKTSIISALESTKRTNMKKMIEWLNGEGFFTSPASARFHGCYVGGLAQHSWDVYQNLTGILMGLEGIDQPVSPGQKPLPLTKDNITIACLLHDINKIGLYLKTKPGSKFPYYCSKTHPKGHGQLSLDFACKIIPLDPIEMLMIKFHMGIYGTFEMKDYCAEYPLLNVHDKEAEKKWSKEQKEADKEARYCTSLRNCWYHNPICKFFSIADELAAMGEKLKK